ncbi:hypothetical protein HU200_010730 [Digitaria exilis]|uniref:Caffeoyl-CoA O-methyltransferase n=1 Tax=Digitaria exilis TaxID=1010633 RepID=A0A835KN86_9POAL|nr:hypothetical protein HU200_010730 [Digitaria exilis]
MAAATTGGEVKAIHSSESTKTLLKSEALYEMSEDLMFLSELVILIGLGFDQYMLNLMVYPRENEHLRELRLITEKHSLGFMGSPPEEAQMLSLLLKVMGAKNTIEVGVFTGCSVLTTALAIPDDGKIVAIDVSREFFDLGLPVIQKAGVAHKVDFRQGPALPILSNLLAEEGNEGKFDFAFVDADKGNYGNYHEQLLRLVRVGGVLAYDNTLWGGSVAMPDDAPLTEHDREYCYEYFELGLPFFHKAGVAHKVAFRRGPALEQLDELLAADDERHVDAFDFAFVDADKTNYVRHHERLLRLVPVGGAIVYDNTLWDGTVALPPEDAPGLSEYDRMISAAIRDLNARLAADERVEVCQLTVGDGVTICRRVV